MSINRIKYLIVGIALLGNCASGFAQEFWRNIFSEKELQDLIELALQHNTDLNVARLRIEQAEATYKSARLATLPSLAFSPSAGISSFGGSLADKTYSLPLQASWQADVFGKLKNAKLQQKMLVDGGQAYKQAVQVQTIASIARLYYQCRSLRQQLNLARQSVEVWNETVRAMKAFMEEGQYTDAAVSQAEASREAVKTTALDLEQQIRESENSIRQLIGDTLNDIRIMPMATEDSDFSHQIHLPTANGIPLQQLSHRPDVRQAELNLAAAVYATKEAKAAFYPSLTLSGTAGWTNSSGVIVNPGKVLLEALASITQPIFQNGRLKAELNIKKSQQEEASLQFRQTLLNAGIEINNALTQIQTYTNKSALLQNQVKALERTVNSTRLLQQNGSSNYLEVLTAQESLLSAQLSELQNLYNKTVALIVLYQATTWE